MVVRYQFASAGGRLPVQAFAAGMLGGFAHSPKFAIAQFQGEMSFDPSNPEAASLELKVRADSLHLTDAVKETDKQEIENAMLQDVLEVNKYLEISFRSTQIAATTIADN